MEISWHCEQLSKDKCFLQTKWTMDTTLSFKKEHMLYPLAFQPSPGGSQPPMGEQWHQWTVLDLDRCSQSWLVDLHQFEKRAVVFQTFIPTFIPTFTPLGSHKSQHQSLQSCYPTMSQPPLRPQSLLWLQHSWESLGQVDEVLDLLFQHLLWNSIQKLWLLLSLKL